ncbi:MAG: 3-methyladenine DNA glycosylase [Phycisphaeraceae bacterium]|nr:3-methyladenine DNA glycosylase [Phycisphaeraceae bacterium]|tara:strand:- start:913 stop:1518 length:606 start_codon:yes stop_codon:yes gene_type:complete
MPTYLTRSFYRRDVVKVARELLGHLLVHVNGRQRVSGLIVETEAYLGIPDKAAHTCNGRRTARNESMWRDGGHTYVYFTYGMHHCVNVVAGVEDEPVAVLLRALEPVDGMQAMYRRRPAAKCDTDLCSGPAKLAKALQIDRQLDRIDLVKSKRVFIERIRATPLQSQQVATGPRIGIAHAAEWTHKPLRFWLKNSTYISHK